MRSGWLGKGEVKQENSKMRCHVHVEDFALTRSNGNPNIQKQEYGFKHKQWIDVK